MKRRKFSKRRPGRRSFKKRGSRRRGARKGKFFTVARGGIRV